MTQNQTIQFLRTRDYVFIKELGQGACGKTILIHDDQINEYFVCKKYSPLSDANRETLFSNFVREIKLLHQIYHTNVVRVFNSYLYPDKLLGFILMEYVEGSEIDDFMKRVPEKSNELFLQVVNGFQYLETNNILHRDIRPQNIMVRDDGVVKIIDLGFGKQVKVSEDFGKSISLNLWCEPPKEFADAIYDFKSEVYFIGKLFEKLIRENRIETFKYKNVLSRMCAYDPESRIRSFFDVDKEIQGNKFYETDFDKQEISLYRDFATHIAYHITKIENGAKYIDDVDRIQNKLEDAYRMIMLEDNVPDCSIITKCFIDGPYYYRKEGFPVDTVKEFLRLLRAATPEKKRILMANLHTRLDAISRYDKSPPDDDVPF